MIDVSRVAARGGNVRRLPASFGHPIAENVQTPKSSPPIGTSEHQHTYIDEIFGNQLAFERGKFIQRI